MDNMPKAGEKYRHFKGKEYEIVDIATHTETGETMVVYRSLSGEKECFVRPLGMFVSKVDKEKYPDATQEYRFEQIGEAKAEVEAEAISTPQADPTLLQFLDACTNEDKWKVLISRKDYLNDGILEAMAASLEIELPEGDLERKFQYLKKSLEVIDRLEGTHMR